MGDIHAFRAYRYDLGRVGSLADVIAPPYDVIDPTLQQQLYERSPFNAVRVELPQDGPGKYQRAGQTLRDWLAAQVLRQDSARSLYVCEQQFSLDGRTHHRRGFFARVRLAPLGQGIFPHEQTMGGPKADRLELMRATGFNLSPIFGLFPDDGQIFQHFEPLIRTAPPLEATDHLGVVHRLWVLTDPAAINAVIGLMGSKPIFIADGHHRYETSLNYLAEQRAAGEVADDDAPANFCLMMLVGTSDHGLAILPTHRLVSGLPPMTAAELQAKLVPHFTIEPAATPQDCWDDLELFPHDGLLGFGTAADGQWFLARLRDPAVMESLAPKQSPEWRRLGVSILHKLVLEKLLNGTGQCRYVHSLGEVNEAVAAKSCRIACLVPPATMPDVQTLAGRRKTMPAKSTYFYPKLPSGLVFNSLKKD